MQTYIEFGRGRPRQRASGPDPKKPSFLPLPGKAIMRAMACLSCVRDFHEECGTPCCCSETPPVVVPQATFSVQPKGIRAVTISAGRKEAAKLYPIDKEAPCEWRGLANCGGGKHPIVGCISGRQIARHHGPNKNTTENKPENIHRICKSCHERWHAKNNSPYKEDPQAYTLLPHKPRIATTEELIDGKVLEVYSDGTQGDEVEELD